MSNYSTEKGVWQCQPKLAIHPEVRILSTYIQNKHKYVCITTYQSDTKSYPNPNPDSNPSTKQHAIVNIELNMVTCPTYPDKFTRDMLLYRLCDFRL